MAVQPMIVGDVAQVVLFQRVWNQTVLNVLYYKLALKPAAAEYFEQLEDLLDGVCDPAGNTIVKYMLDAQSENLRFIWGQAQAVHPTRKPYTRYPIDTDGKVLTPCTAPNVAATLTKQTERVGRGKVGSFHLGGLPAESYEIGELKAATVVQLNTLATALTETVKSPVLEYEWEPVTFNPAAAGEPVTNPILNVFPQVTLRVMRRRTVGLGI